MTKHHIFRHSSYLRLQGQYNKPIKIGIIEIREYSSELLGHLLSLCELPRGSKINNLELSVRLLGVQQKIFRLEISMDNVFTVAVDNS